MAGTFDNHQFFIVSRKLFISIFAEIAAVGVAVIDSGVALSEVKSFSQ